MPRYLVVALGVASGQWFFVALTIYLGDAQWVATRWLGTAIFDLATGEPC